jgi:hypothetical protein
MSQSKVRQHTQEMLSRVKPDEMKQIKCPCGGGGFIKGVIISEISKLNPLNPTGSDVPIMHECLTCSKCGEILK